MYVCVCIAWVGVGESNEIPSNNSCGIWLRIHLFPGQRWRFNHKNKLRERMDRVSGPLTQGESATVRVTGLLMGLQAESTSSVLIPNSQFHAQGPQRITQIL